MEPSTAKTRTTGARRVRSFQLDTDICSAHLRQRGQVTGRLVQHAGALHLSAITRGELYAWVMRTNAPSKRLQGLREMLNDTTVPDVTAEVAEKFGQLQAGLLDTGKPAPGMDLMIAATALVHDLTLVTHNTQDFVNVPGLRVEDWPVP